MIKSAADLRIVYVGESALGSSSKNTAAILHAAGLKDHFDACVDGLEAEASRKA
jgi:hypothetical protein